MKRRLLPILMTLVLVCALPIWAAFVTSGDVTNPLVCTAGAAEPSVPVEVSTATDLQKKIDAGKSVKLMADISITSTLKISSSLTLDLNGHVLKMTGSGSVLRVSGRATLTITDSRPQNPHTGSYAGLPAGGVITGGKADKGGGILLDGGCTLKLTGGCITDCHATDTGGGGVVLNGDTAILYMSGTARIENCTAGKMWGAAIFNSGTMYADGGTVDGTMNNQGTIRLSEGAAAETVFNGTVYNRSAGTIIAGRYNETVENRGTITGGIFYGGVTNDGGKINDGAYETVKFNSDNGAQAKEEKVLRGQKVAKPTDDPTKSGHTFTGWYLGDEKYNFDTPVTAPLTLTAKWEKVPSSGGYYYYQPTTDTKANDTKGSPKTFDAGIALYVGMALTSAAGVAFVGKKRED